MSDKDLTPPADSRPISWAPGYRVCDGGAVWSCRTKSGKIGTTWHIVKPHKPHPIGGYIQVGLKVDGKPIERLVHRLVLEAFVGPRPEGMECCHNDGNPANNFVSNLRWDTREANNADKAIHGTVVKGEAHRCSKLKASDIPEIFRLFNEGMTQERLAEVYGVSSMTVIRILTHKAWNHVGSGMEKRNHVDMPKGEDHKRSKLKESDIPEIFRLAREGVKQRDIAKMFSVCQGTINNVLLRKIWKHVES